MDHFSSLKRRHFFKLSAGALMGSMVGCSGSEVPLNEDFPIEVHDDLLRGHHLFEGQPPKPAQGVQRREVLVVGAGIAGLSAAAEMSDRDVVVCEIGKRPGGSSSAWDFRGVAFAQGAHYELEYPDYYGEEVLELLESLNVVEHNATRNMWEFVDRKYLIKPERESRTYTNNGFRDDPLPQNKIYRDFVAAVRQFGGQMPMPTRLISPAFRSYDQITFYQFLENLNLHGSQELLTGFDYQLIDDFGAGCKQVSALAGIHYYQCRPYYSEELPHFSPPMGNAYFVEKLLGRLPQENLWCSHLVRSIKPEDDRFKIEILDLEQNTLLHLDVDQVVYAGQKKALKYVVPQDAELFAANQYAPWLTVNLMLDERGREGFWQNEMVGQDSSFLGFVNSTAQFGEHPITVLTAYFCLPQQERENLRHYQQHVKRWVSRTLEMVNLGLGRRIDGKVIKAFVKLHGHAMPIPKPGYLFRDPNQHRSFKGLVYAGVDCARLPLLFEALDSGILAATELKRH